MPGTPIVGVVGRGPAPDVHRTLRIPPASNNIEKMNRRIMTNHHAGSEEQILGVTNDAVLRPIGALMVVVGTLWALFVGMATEAGTLAQPLAAGLLIALGVLLAAVGKPSENI